MSGYKTPPNPDTGSDDAGTDHDDSSEESEQGDQTYGQEGRFDGEMGNSDEEGLVDDNEKDGPARKRRYVKRGRRDWSELGFYDRIKMLDSEIDAAILAIAAAKMNYIKEPKCLIPK